MTLENARLATAINETADTVVITDLRARITFVNPAFERVTGYSRDEAMGKNQARISGSAIPHAAPGPAAPQPQPGNTTTAQ